MTLDKSSIALLYRKRAKRYDFSANAYYLLGFREFAYRNIGVEALNLKKGDTVVEIGCGTGLNFSLLRKEVGPNGNIIGVDLTLEMLEEADKRIRRNSWQNVTLVQSDAAVYRFSEHIDGIISTFALTLVPEYDRVIQKGAAALSPNARFVIVDFKKTGQMADVDDKVICDPYASFWSFVRYCRPSSMGIRSSIYDHGRV